MPRSLKPPAKLAIMLVSLLLVISGDDINEYNFIYINNLKTLLNSNSSCKSFFIGEAYS